MISKKDVERILDDIPDPEIGVSILQLGLVYEIEVQKDSIRILMTLTSIGCPLFPHIETAIRESLGKNKEVGKVVIDLTFDPPWSPDKMTEEAKQQLGFA